MYHVLVHAGCVTPSLLPRTLFKRSLSSELLHPSGCNVLREDPIEFPNFSSVQSCRFCDPTDARPLCQSPTPGVYSNSRPLSRWCHPTISSSVIPFSSHLRSFPASGSFLVSQFFSSGGQTIGASALASGLPMNIQDWFPPGLVWSPCSPKDSQESSPTPYFKRVWKGKKGQI